MVTNSYDNLAEIRLQQMIERLKESGFRITPQRYAVLNVLTNSPDHPSAESKNLDEITSKMMEETGFKILAHHLDFM